MMTLPAYCGFFCDRCPVYRAAADGDKSMKEELAQRYTTAGQPLSAEDIRCQGCRAQGKSAIGILPKMLYPVLRQTKRAVPLRYLSGVPL